MSPWLIALILGLLAIAAVFGIYLASATGVGNDGIWKFELDENPLGFFVVLGGKVFVLSGTC